MARFTFLVQVEQRFVVFAAHDGAAHASQVIGVRAIVQWVILVLLLRVPNRLNLVLRAQLLVVVLSLSPLFLDFIDASTYLVDFLDQVHVVGHDLKVVRLMNLAFRLKSLFQRVHGVLQELPLVLILVLNVLIDLAVLLLLILDKPEQALVHSDLELLVIISELHDLVHCILEVVDDRVVVAKHVPILLYMLLNDPLSHPQILHHEPQTGVN